MKEERERVSRGVGTTIEYKANVQHVGVNTESVVLIRPSAVSPRRVRPQPTYLPRRRGNRIVEQEYKPEELAIQWSSVPGESLILEAEEKLKEGGLKDAEAKQMTQKTKDMQKRLRQRQRERMRQKKKNKNKTGADGGATTRTRGLKPKKRYKAKPFVDTCTPRLVPRA